MNRKHPAAFPELEAQLEANGIRKRDVAAMLGIAPESLSRKLTARVPWTLDEMRKIAALFPDFPAGVLFGIGNC